MKVNAELITIEEEMQSKELVDALNKNFQELKESFEQRDQVMLNAIGNLEIKTTNLENRLERVELNLYRVIDHLSGKKLLTEE